MTTLTRPDVPLVRVGTWAGTTGVTPVSAEDLDSIEAAYADTDVDRPPIKLGHDPDSPLNASLFGADGEPAFGWIGRVSRGDGSAARPDKDTLYGDYVGMPSKLAEVSDTAWRRRSAEIAWGVTTHAGKTYKAALHAVSLLGIKKPAVKGLGDVLSLYAEVDTVAGVTSVLCGEGVPQIDMAALTRFAAALEVYGDTTTVPPAVADPHDGGPDAKTSPATAGTEEGTRMTIKKADVDLALEKAGDEDVSAALRELLDATEAPVAPVVPIVAPVEVVAPVVTAAAEGDGDTVTITKSTFAELQTGAAAGVTAQAAIDKSRRDALVVTAFREGRITNTERTTWREKLDENEGITTSLLSALEPRFAVDLIGDDRAPVAQLGEADKAAWAEFDASIGLLG